MGDELGKIGQTIYLRATNGETVPLSGIVNGKLSEGPEFDGLSDDFNVDISIGFEMEKPLSRKSIFMLLLGNKRLVRRAIRWQERLRRDELKTGTRCANKCYIAMRLAREGGTKYGKSR